MASYLALCARCSARVRFMSPPDISGVLCDPCRRDIAANKEAAMSETLKERLERKKGATKPGQQVSEAQQLIEGTPLDRQAGRKG